MSGMYGEFFQANFRGLRGRTPRRKGGEQRSVSVGKAFPCTKQRYL